LVRCTASAPPPSADFTRAAPPLDRLSAHRPRQEAEAGMARVLGRSMRATIPAKTLGAALLITLADLFFFLAKGPPGWTLGGFALAFALVLFATQPALRRDHRGQIFLGGAIIESLVLIDRPTFAGWFLFGCLIGMASLSPRAGPGEDAWRWFQRLAWQPMLGSIGPAFDVVKLMDRRLKRSRFAVVRLIPMLVLPLIGGLIFLGLFAAANPVIADLLSHFDFRLDLGRLVFWGFTLVVVWAVIRPRFLKKPLRTPGLRGERPIPGVSLASVSLSLILFNALFAVQNGLDIAFLWSGARLPAQFTLAEYVHAGVYPLMASALVTGLLVLIALRPGSDVADSRPVRLLVMAWVAQNLFVVASSAYRMLLYVESFSLTRLRILVLIWMMLVAVGLLAILWRVLRDRPSGWLLDVNARAVLLAIFAVSVVDIGAVAAWWNVNNAKEVGGSGVNLDLCYLRLMGPSAAVPLSELEQRRLSPAARERVAIFRRDAVWRLQEGQADWRRWTYRGERRLGRAITLTGRPQPPGQAPLSYCGLDGD
jgi:hypothetical protein